MRLSGAVIGVPTTVMQRGGWRCGGWCIVFELSTKNHGLLCQILISRPTNQPPPLLSNGLRITTVADTAIFRTNTLRHTLIANPDAKSSGW
jgi:hypothetical protein